MFLFGGLLLNKQVFFYIVQRCLEKNQTCSWLILMLYQLYPVLNEKKNGIGAPCPVFLQKIIDLQ